MKANKHRGNGRPGAAKHNFTTIIKKAASYCGEKIMKGGLINNDYAFNRHSSIMQLVCQGKYYGNDMHYRKQAAYYANR